MVLVHGLMGYSFSWRRNLETLSRHYTVYAVDLPGIGYSERPCRGVMRFDMRSVAQRLLLWMREAGLRQSVLVGTSHGGAVATMMTEIDLLQGTGLIDRFILVSPVNPWSSVGLRRTRFFGHPFGAFCLRSLNPLVLFVRQWALTRMYGDPSKITPETRAGYDAPLSIPGTLDYLLGIVQYWRTDLIELEQALERIKDLPVLLIWGSQDSAVPLRSANELHKRWPGSELAVLRGAGHLPYEEAPEEFQEILLRYLGNR